MFKLNALYLIKKPVRHSEALFQFSFLTESEGRKAPGVITTGLMLAQDLGPLETSTTSSYSLSEPMWESLGTLVSFPEDGVKGGVTQMVFDDTGTYTKHKGHQSANMCC